MTDYQKQPLIVSLVLALVGGGIYLAAERTVRASQQAAEHQARQLGDVPLHLATTFGQMKSLLGPPETVVMPSAQQGHVVTKQVNIRQVSWDAALVVAQFHVAGLDESQNAILDDAAPVDVEVHAPFGGSLDGVRLGDTCRNMRAQFKPLTSGSSTLRAKPGPVVTCFS